MGSFAQGSRFVPNASPSSSSWVGGDDFQERRTGSHLLPASALRALEQGSSSVPWGAFLPPFSHSIQDREGCAQTFLSGEITLSQTFRGNLRRESRTDSIYLQRAGGRGDTEPTAPWALGCTKPRSSRGNSLMRSQCPLSLKSRGEGMSPGHLKPPFMTHWIEKSHTQNTNPCPP